MPLGRKAEHARNIIIQEYVDEELSSKAGCKQLLRNTSKRQFGLMRLLALDRFSSECIAAAGEHTTHLAQSGASFWRYCKPMLNMAALYKASIAWATGYRNQRHVKNVRLGQARKRAQVRAQGSTYQHERRPTNPATAGQVLAAHGLSRRKNAVATGVLVGTVQHYPVAIY